MSKKTWLRRGFWLVVTLIVVLAGLSGLMRTGAARRFLAARLETAFGRPVEVGTFDLSLLGVPRIEASHITVGEDPQFGNEYFLRAERLSISIRWRALILGRLEFGTLSFTRPSLNLVRLSDGRWNLESWLPPAPALPSVPRPPGLPAPQPRFRRIEVDGGRINLKRGVEKHPFALVEVTASIEQQSAGNWRMDLEAQPARAGVTLQEPGTLRLRGSMGGAAARLQPADLLFTWQDASLADVLRLARSTGYGVRGRLAMQLRVRSLESPEDRLRVGASRWALQGSARIEKVHRWDLPERPANPVLSVTVLAALRPGDGVLDLFESAIEAPHSKVQLRGRVSWTRGIYPDVRLTTAAIGMPDLLDWYRAFQPGIADDLSLQGIARLDLNVSGWPLRIRQGMLASNGATMRTVSLPAPVGIGRLSARVNEGMLELAPLVIELPSPAASQVLPNSPSKGAAKKTQVPKKTTPSPGLLRWRSSQGNALRIEGSLQLPRANLSRAGNHSGAWRFKLQLSGQTARSQDVLALAAALGRPIGTGWAADGRAEVRLGWQGTVRPWNAIANGTLDLQGVELRTTILDQSVSLRAARIELKPGVKSMILKDGRAFGAEWKGTIFRKPAAADGSAEWKFDLSASRLDAAELNRWLGAQPSPSFLQRISPFAKPDRASSERDAAIERLRARGRLSIEEFVLAPLSVRRLKAQVEIAGRKLSVRQAQGEFYRGSLDANFNAELSSQPAYRFESRFSRVNLAQLADDTVTLNGRFGGEANGLLNLAAHGTSKEELVGSLEGGGNITVRGARLQGLNLANVSPGRQQPSDSMQFQFEAGFSVGERQIRFNRLVLREGENHFEATGSADFARALDLHVRRVSSERRAASPLPSRQSFRLTGRLEAPVLNSSRVPSASTPKAGRKSAAKKP